MEAEEFMKLFDSLWFGSKSEEIPTTAMLMFQKIDETEHLQIRSFRSERSMIVKPKPLQKILSEKKIIADEISRNKRQRERGEKQGKGLSRSLSALEFEEVKGFMDLGFIFDEQDKNQRLISIIPRLQKLGKIGVDEKGEICRPYLSEAWGVLNERESGVLMNWKMPSTKNEITMKDHLRFWAHVVASNVNE